MGSELVEHTVQVSVPMCLCAPMRLKQPCS